MDEITTAPPPAHRPRHRFAAGAAVLVEGLLGLTWGWISLALFFSGLGSVPALGAGLLLLVPWAWLMLLAVRYERSRAVAVHGLEVIVPTRRRSTRSGASRVLHDLWLDVSSWPFWRGVLHHHLAMLSATIVLLVSLTLLWTGWVSAEILILRGAVTLGSVELPIWALALISLASLLLSGLTIVLGVLADRGLAAAMISGSEEDLRVQVAELSEQRQGAVDAAEQERRRIERDLHDGVQPRLVAMAMTLGMARSAIHRDPERAAVLVEQAHGEAKGIMTDLRQLARGIHPAVLTDRGLDAALSALAARSPVPVDLHTDLTTPLDREREAVAYFVVAEALTNIAKHSGATRAEVALHEQDGALRVVVRDDGRGGARVRRDGISTGLAGLTDRVRATGGRLEVTGTGADDRGGTALTAVIPLHSRPGIAPATGDFPTPDTTTAPDATAAGAPATPSQEVPR